MANQTRYIKTPFAQSGNRAEVPNVSVGGAVAFDTGFGTDYELPQGAAGRKRIERDKYNGVLYDVTKNLKQWQENLYPTWIQDDGTGAPFSYPKGMVVSHSGQDWYSNEAFNQEEPGTGSKWTEISDINFGRSFANVNEMANASGHSLGLRYSTGRTEWEVVSFNTNVPLSGGLFAKAISPVCPTDFGADGTGVADSTFAFVSSRNAADASGQIQVWEGKTFKLKDYEILSNQGVHSEGAVITPLDNTSTALLTGNAERFSITGKITIRGHRASLADVVNTGECGLRIVGGKEFKIENAIISLFKGIGYERVDTAFTSYGNKAQGVNITVVDCLQGEKLSAQYDVYTNHNVVGNEIGAESIGGNLVWVGGNCTDNTDGFKITDGPNNAHGIAVGVQFNHNKNRNILIDKTRLGHTFSACHSYANDALGAGKIEIVQSAGVDFLGGAYDCEFYLDEFLGVNEDNYLRNAYLPGDYGPSGVKSTKIYNQHGARSTSMRVSGCYGLGAINAIDGYNINDISPCAYSVKRLGSSPQSLPTGIETTLTFNVLGILGDIRGNIIPLGTGQGVFPTVIDGYYTCELGVVLAGTTFDAEASYIVLVVDDEPVSYEYGKPIGLVGGKQGFKYSFTISEYATTNIKFVAYAVGTDLVHGIGSFHSRAFVSLIQK